MIVLSTVQMKMAEKETDRKGISYLDMMENAGSAAAALIMKRFSGRLYDLECVVLCGSGNNGGDGFVVARLLKASGARVTAVLCSGVPKTADASKNFMLLEDIKQLQPQKDRDAIIEAVKNAAVIVDAVFGTGFRGVLPEEISRLFALCNETVAYKLALDIPSGINADSGEVAQTCFYATQTVAFAAPKPAHLRKELQPYIGQIIVADIGISEETLRNAKEYPDFLSENIVLKLLPKRSDHSHKGSFGKTMLYCGSVGMGGAAMMSTLAAMRCGSGLTTLATVKDIAYMTAPHLMEATTLVLPQNKDGSLHEAGVDMLLRRAAASDVVAAGCGISTADTAKLAIGRLLTECKGKKMILDADGINCIAGNIDVLKHKASELDLVITPHPGEMARLCKLTVSEVEQNRVTLAKQVAMQYGITVVLKGENTVIASKDGASYQNRTGNSGLAKGGSGDLLTGMIAGFCAIGLSTFEASCAAVYLHGAAADELAKRYSKHSMLARDILEELPVLLKQLDR